MTPSTTRLPSRRSASASQIINGDSFTCVRLGGGIRCWGSNLFGELGDGTTTSNFDPVSALGIGNATQMSTGVRDLHACALLASHTVKCWGENDEGQLGNGNTVDQSSPVAVAGIKTATQVATGGSHTCALLADRTIKCWGWGTEGELGFDDITNRRSPPLKVVAVSTAIQISAGERHSCALLANHTVWCWGDNKSGDLGDGTTASATARSAWPDFPDIGGSRRPPARSGFRAVGWARRQKTSSQ